MDLRPQYSGLRKELLDSYRTILDRGMFILGREVEMLEKEIASYVGVRYAIGVGSGTDAIELALRSLELGKAEVIIPANAYPSIFGVLASGCTPKIIDVDEQTLALDEELLQRGVTSATKALLVVHLFGKNMLSPTLLRFVKTKGLHLIEDCAQAFSGKWGNRYLGTFGDLSCFSFYPTKPLGAFGDGGMVCTNSTRLAQRVRELRMYGERERFHTIGYGVNSRLDEFQAAILRLKLPHVEKWRDERRRLHKQYERLLSSVKAVRFVSGDEEGEVSAAHLTVVRAHKRNDLKRFLLGRGIMTQIHYPTPLSDISYLRRFVFARRAPISSTIAKELLSLPSYNGLRQKTIQLIASNVRRFYRQDG